MQRADIVNAYILIRKTNNTIPDEVLDFMYEAALEKFAEQENHVSHKHLMMYNATCKLTNELCFSSFNKESLICKDCGGHDYLMKP